MLDGTSLSPARSHVACSSPCSMRRPLRWETMGSSRFVGFLGTHRYTMIYLGLSPLPVTVAVAHEGLNVRDPLLEIQWSLWWLESWAGVQPKIDYNAYIDDSLQPAAPKHRAARNIGKYPGPSTKTNRIINNTPNRISNIWTKKANTS